jgi:hypothetical protein
MEREGRERERERIKTITIQSAFFKPLKCTCVFVFSSYYSSMCNDDFDKKPDDDKKMKKPIVGKEQLPCQR